jgi:Transposase family tnp2
MLPLGVVSGPKAEKFDLDSYLTPFFEELERLEDGVPAYDTHTDSYFSLKAFVCLVTGDTPAISKLFRLSGHTAAYPCRACMICSTPYLNRYLTKSGANKGETGKITRGYYPLSPPTKFPAQISADQREKISRLPSYENHDDLPLRSHDDYIHDGEASLADPDLRHTSGIKGVSPFTRHPTIYFSASVPFDFMHLIYLNFVRDLCGLFNGTFFKDTSLNKHAASLSTSEWTTFGADMAKIEAPTSWGRPPRDISRYMGSFKAEDLYNFLMYYMRPLIHGLVSRDTFQALRRLVVLTTMATSIEIRYTDMDFIETQLTLFMKWFYDAFYQNDHERLPICKYTEHCLLHIVRDIRNWGSASYYWQFPEVLCISCSSVLIVTGALMRRVGQGAQKSR